MRARNFCFGLTLAAAAAGKTAVHWSGAGGDYCLDVDGFESGFPKNMQLWKRSSHSNYNDNEYFSLDDGELKWVSDKNAGNYCLMAEHHREGMQVVVNNCNGGWKWEAVKTAYGFRLSPSGWPDLCMSIADSTSAIQDALSVSVQDCPYCGRKVYLQKCTDDSKQSFTGDISSHPAPAPTPGPVGPTPAPPTPAPLVPTPAPPTPAPLVPTPAPATPEPAPLTPTGDDAAAINDFNNPDVGIAVSMLSWDAIKNPGNNNGINGQDRGKFLYKPDATFHQSYQQAVSITHNGKKMLPYIGADTVYGVVLRIGPDSNYWQYFQVNEQNELCAFPHDGYKCGGGIAAWRQGLVTKSWASYDWFKDEKNKIVSQTTGTNYNEFDTAGMSSTAFAGFLTTQYRSGIPKEHKDLFCSFLKKGVPGVSRPSWPVYTYTNNPAKLEVTDHVVCSNERTVVV